MSTTQNAINDLNTNNISAVAAGTQTATSGGITFSNSNGVSFGMNNGVLTGTVATNYQSQGAYLTTAALSQDSSKYAGINGAITGGSMTVNTSGVSINLPAYLTTAALSQDSSKYAGTNGAITGGSITVNTSGVSINLPAYLTTADLSQNSSKYVQNWKLTGNTAGTTSSAQGTDLWFSGGNNITVSGNNNTIAISVGNYITTADLSQNSSKYAGTNGAITGGSITVNTSGVSINLPAYLTTADLSQNSSKYAGINSAVTNGSLTVNTSGISINIPVQTNQTEGIYIVGNTTGQSSSSTQDVRTLSIQGTGGISIGWSNSSLIISGATGGAGGVALYDGANSISSGTARFSNSNGVSFGFNGQTITASVAAQSNQTEGWYAVGNTTGQSSSTTADARSQTLSGANGISVGFSQGSIILSANPVGGQILLFANTSVPGGNTIASTAAETAFNSSYTLPANSLAVGQAIRVKLAGVYSTDTVAPTIIGKIKFGSVVMLVTPTINSLIGTSSNLGWTAEATFIVQSIGASGAIEAQGIMEFDTTALSGINVNLTNTAAKTVDTTASNAITATVTWGTSSANNTITLREMTVELLQSGAINGAGMSNLGNTLGTSGTINGQHIFVGSNDVRLSQSISGNSATLSIDRMPIKNWIHPYVAGGGGVTYGYNNQTLTTGSMSIQLMQQQNYLSATRADMMMNVSSLGTAANNSTNTLGISLWMGVYSDGGSTLQSMSTASAAYTKTWSSNATQSLVGRRFISTPLNINMTPGQYYLVANMSTSSSRQANTLGPFNIGAASLSFGGLEGLEFDVLTNETLSNIFGYQGIYTAATTGALPDNINATGIQCTGSNQILAQLIWRFKG